MIHCNLLRLVSALFLCALVLSIATQAGAAEPTLSVAASGETLHVALPLPGNGKIDMAADWQLVEIDDPKVKLPVELSPGIAEDGSITTSTARLVATIPPRAAAKSPRRFRLKKAAAKTTVAFRLEDTSDKTIKLSEGDAPVFAYNHGTITDESVPKKESRRSRGCYVHPLWGIDGEVLTDDFPIDHYHHHGLFWAWPKVTIDGKKYDLWLGHGIKQQFVAWMHKQAGPVSGVLGVENGWFVGDKKVMTERVWLRSFKAGKDSRVLDVQLVLIPLDKPITLQGAAGKGYGGLTVRYAVKDQKKAVITVPGGVEPNDIKNKPLEWCDMAYDFGGKGKPSGATIFVSPNHPNYPPSFLTRHYGPICVGHPGGKAKTFTPGEVINMNYRIWIHKQAVDEEQLKRQQEAYKASAEATWQ